MKNFDHEDITNPNGIVKTPGLPEVIPKMTRIMTSLKHWTTFHAIAECGTFSSAAKFLGVSQASISYTIAQLEETLGIPLLRLEGRKYGVTEVGHELLARSKFLLSEAIALETLASALRCSRIPQLRVAIEKDFPTRDVIPALSQYLATRHKPKIELTEIQKSEMERVLQDREVDVAISSVVPNSYAGELFVEIEYLAVAVANHPIFLKPPPISRSDLTEFVQIMALEEKTVQMDSYDGLSNLVIGKFWFVSNIETAITAVCEGIGYAWLPTSRIRESLKSGKLAALPLHTDARFIRPFYLIQGHSSFYGETGRLMQLLREVASKKFAVARDGAAIKLRR